MLWGNWYYDCQHRTDSCAIHQLRHRSWTKTQILLGVIRRSVFSWGFSFLAVSQILLNSRLSLSDSLLLSLLLWKCNICNMQNYHWRSILIKPLNAAPQPAPFAEFTLTPSLKDETRIRFQFFISGSCSLDETFRVREVVVFFLRYLNSWLTNFVQLSCCRLQPSVTLLYYHHFTTKYF